MEKNEIAFAMKIEVLSAPGLEMRIALGASSGSAYFEFARGTAAVTVYVVSVITLFTVIGITVTAIRSSRRSAADDTFVDASGLCAAAGTAVAVSFYFAAALPVVSFISAAISILDTDSENNLGVDSNRTQSYRDTDTNLDISTLETDILG